VEEEDSAETVGSAIISGGSSLGGGSTDAPEADATFSTPFFFDPTFSPELTDSVLRERVSCSGFIAADPAGTSFSIFSA